MKFLYTGAASFNVAQISASLSLGGFVSSTQVPNDFMNNVFSSLSELAKNNLRRETICIALYNDDVDLAQDVTITFDAEFDNLMSDFEIAFSASSIDDCDNIYFEKINDVTAKPYLEFEAINASNNSFSVGDIQPGAYLGIWLVRKLTKTKVAPITCEALKTHFDNSTEPELEETFSIDLSWQDDNSHSSS